MSNKKENFDLNYLNKLIKSNLSPKAYGFDK